MHLINFAEKACPNITFLMFHEIEVLFIVKSHFWYMSFAQQIFQKALQQKKFENYIQMRG